MHIVKKKEVSLFLQAAESFDTDVAELERLSRQIQEMEFEKDSDFNRAQKLMGHFTATSIRVGEGVKTLAQELDASRIRAERAAEVVAERAMDFKKRQDEISVMLERFQALGKMARELTEEISEMKKASDESGDRPLLTNYLPSLDARMGLLLDEAKRLKVDSGAAHLKTLEQNSDSLSQSLASARRLLKNLESESAVRTGSL